MTTQERARLAADVSAPIGRPAEAPTVKTAPKANPGRWWGVFCGFVGHDMHRLNPTAACVWFALFRNSRNGIACAGIDQLCEITAQSERTVRYRIRELIAAGLIRVETRGRRNQGVSRYRLLSTGNPLPVDAILNRQSIACTNRQPIAGISMREKARRNRLPRFAASEADGQAEPSGLVALAVRNGWMVTP